MRKATGEKHREPSQASLRDMPEVDFAKVKAGRNPYPRRIAAEGISIYVDRVGPGRNGNGSVGERGARWDVGGLPPPALGKLLMCPGILAEPQLSVSRIPIAGETRSPMASGSSVVPLLTAHGQAAYSLGMGRDEAIAALRRFMPTLVRDFGVRRVALFGSTARGDARPDSDLDLLVEFAVGPTFDSFMGLKFFLEDNLGRKVDLVTPDSLKPRMRPVIEREAVDVG